MGHDVTSCDILPTNSQGKHYQGDVFDIINQRWDMMIAHPPCTYLTVTGNKWFFHPEDKNLPSAERRPHPRFPNRHQHRQEAIDFFMKLANADIDRICIENPVGIMSTKFRKPDQVIQPYQFGHVEAKRTCLWLKNLPLLNPTSLKKPEYVVSKSGKRASKFYYDSWGWGVSKEERTRLRSKTFQGIADAMANQWSLTQKRCVHLAV